MYMNITDTFHRIPDTQSCVITKVHNLLGLPSEGNRKYAPVTMPTNRLFNKFCQVKVTVLKNSTRHTIIPSCIHKPSLKFLPQIIWYSNTPRLYSQWLNSVIYWLINHCTDRPDVIRAQILFSWRHLSLRHCNVDNKRHTVVFTTNWRPKCS